MARLRGAADVLEYDQVGELSWKSEALCCGGYAYPCVTADCTAAYSPLLSDISKAFSLSSSAANFVAYPITISCDRPREKFGIAPFEQSPFP
jgi:hypothetical protein